MAKRESGFINLCEKIKFSLVVFDLSSTIISCFEIPFSSAYFAIATASGISSPGPCPPDIMIFEPGLRRYTSIPRLILAARSGVTFFPIKPAPSTTT